MSRSKWKGPYVSEKIIKQLFEKTFYNNTFKTTSRNSEIIYAFVGFVFEIHTGQTFLKLEITEEMVGYKFGEFIFTRTHSPPKKKKVKKKISFKKKITKTQNGTES